MADSKSLKKQTDQAKTPQTFSIRLLGTVEVIRGGTPITPRLPKKGVAILSYLASDPSAPQSRQKLADILWPELPEMAARSNLRQVLLGVKRVLGDSETAPPCLIADRDTIRLDPTCSHCSDIAGFLAPLPGLPKTTSHSGPSACVAHMETLAALYRGDFMDGFFLEGCPEFEDWLQGRREQLLHRALFLLEHLCAGYEEQEAYSRALPFALRFTELAPWNDEGLRRLMRLSALNGQRGFALSRYDAFCRTIKSELGVFPEEQTRKLARSIQTGECRPENRMCRPDPATCAGPPPVAERRQVTILYLQLAALDAPDPDEAMELLHGPQIRCRETIAAGGGHVVRAKDGGLLAYFGYPQASENAALLAVRTALTVVGAGASGLDLRAGVHTGLILTGTNPELPDIIGRASGLAIGLRTLAERGEVVISETTHQLVAGYFDAIALGERSLPGSPRPVKGFRVVQPSGATHRLEAAETLTPLVGRNRELAVLTGLWEEARRGVRRAILLHGDPGIGKSRLAHALKQRALHQHGTVLELRCTAELKQSPFHPVIDLFCSTFGFTPFAPPETRFAMLADALEQSDAERAQDIVPILAELLSLPVAPPYRSPDLSPQQLRERTMAVLADRLRARAATGPVLLVMEDLHWADPTTLELLSLLLEKTASWPVLMVFTARSEFHSPWDDQLVRPLPLKPLTDGEVRSMIGAFAPTIPPTLLEDILERADGVPLFVEELTRAAVAAADREESGIPVSLQDLLAARLDAMAEHKSTAQLAATIGREFSLELLAALSLLDSDEIKAAIEQLHRAGLVSGTAEGGFQFRHALFRDAAYQSQPRADRTAAHRRIAQTLEAQFPIVAQARPELLAKHWNEGGETTQAIACWIKAGRLVQLHFAHQEAFSHFKAGLELLAGLPEEDRKAQLEFELQIGLGAAAYAVEGYASPDGAASFARAVELSEQLEASAKIFQALWGLWAGASSHSDWAHSLTLAQRLVRMARKSDDPLQMQQGHFALGNIQFWRGEFEAARTQLEQAMALYQPCHHEALITGYGENAYATSGGYLSWTLCSLGFPEQALQVGRLSVAEARRAGHPFSLGYALTFFTVLHRMRREPDETLKLAEETIQLGVTHGFPLWQAGAGLKHGWARVMLGDEGGLNEMQESVDAVRTLMNGILIIFLETQADGLRQAGRFEEALGAIREALELVERLDDHHVEAELYRLQGECLLGLSAANTAEAESSFRLALTTSRRQHALLPELRASAAMAKLLCARQKTAEAGRLLAKTYPRFTEGLNLPDLREARELLATLDPPSLPNPS